MGDAKCIPRERKAAAMCSPSEYNANPIENKMLAVTGTKAADDEARNNAAILNCTIVTSITEGER